MKHQIQNLQHISPVFLVGPSGIGKDWIVKQLESTHKFILSTTSRPKRSEEKEGDEYEFISEGEFKKALENNEFATNMKLFSNYYGYRMKAFSDAVESGKTPIAIVYYKALPDLLKVFPNAQIHVLTPPKEFEYKEFVKARMLRRHSSENPDFQKELEKRIKDTENQMKEIFNPDGEIGKYLKRKNSFIHYVYSDKSGADAAEKIKGQTQSVPT